MTGGVHPVRKDGEEEEVVVSGDDGDGGGDCGVEEAGTADGLVPVCWAGSVAHRWVVVVGVGGAG